MALPISENAEQLSKQIEVHPNMVFKISGFSTLFGAAEISEYIRIGDPGLLIGDSWVIGGVRLMSDQSTYISFNSGATTRITQKLDPSRAQGSTVTQMVVSLLDKNNDISKLVSPGLEVTEILLRDCELAVGPKEGSYPQDYSTIFRGQIQQIEAGAGYVNLVLTSAEGKKAIPIFPKIVSKTASPVNYRSATIGDLFFQNREDVTNTVTITLANDGVAGSETVSAAGTAITVHMQSGISTATQIRKAVEGSDLSNQLVTCKITGTGSTPQVASGPTTLGSSTTIVLTDASLLAVPGDALECFVKIDDEILKYTGKSGNTLTGVTRAEMNSTAALHATNKDVSSVYRVTGNPMDIALKTMLSKGPTYFASDVAIKSFNLLPDTTRIDDAIIFDRIDVAELYGVQPGDLVTITGATNPANDVTDAIVNEVGQVNDGSYIILSTPFIDEGTTSAVCKFKSQFNVMPIGMGMTPVEVDVKQHLFIRDTFLPVANRAIIAIEENNGKDWIEMQVYLPAACFSVPRKGRSSVAYHIGPIAREKVVTLDATNVTNAPALKVSRSSSQNFANTIRYNYDFDPVANKFQSIKPVQSSKSLAKVTAQEKNITIESKGTTTALNGPTEVSQTANRLLNRYQYGAEYINGIGLMFGDGYTIEIGDIVAVDYKSLQLTDFKTGTRSGEIRLMECLNKVIDNRTGAVSLDLVNTVYNTNDRFGLISPSTRVGIGSTTTKIILKKTFSTKHFQRESLKWRNYIGQDVMVHSPDWSTVYTTKIISFDTNDPQGLLVSPGLPSAPTEDWIVSPPLYPSDTDPRIQAFWKNRHAFISWTLNVASGASQTVFTLASAPTGIPFKGSTIRVHSADFTNDSGDVTVTDVTGLVVTVDTALGFVPNSTHLVDLIGFPDGQPAYRII